MARFPSIARARRPRPRTKCCICGRGSATTPARAICSAPRSRSSRCTTARFPERLRRVRSRCPASAAPPPARSSPSAPVSATRSSTATCGACWRALFAIEGRTGERAFDDALWQHAERETPDERAGTIRPGDHGSRRHAVHASQPGLRALSARRRCEARRQGRPHDFPAPRKRCGPSPPSRYRDAPAAARATAACGCNAGLRPASGAGCGRRRNSPTPAPRARRPPTNDAASIARCPPSSTCSRIST